MKIISKYKDYYDGVQSLGMDKNLIFERFQSTLEIEKLMGYDDYCSLLYNCCSPILYITIPEKDSVNMRIDLQFLQVGFCGKMYPTVSFRHVVNQKEAKRVSCYSVETTLDYIANLKNTLGKIQFMQEYYDGIAPSEKDLNLYFNNEIFKRDYIHWFHEVNSPVFMFNSYISKTLSVYKNINLSYYDFYKAKDSYAAYQEISQFLSGILTSREPLMDNLTNEEKVRQHGFDPKYGFRRRPND